MLQKVEQTDFTTHSFIISLVCMGFFGVYSLKIVTLQMRKGSDSVKKKSFRVPDNLESQSSICKLITLKITACIIYNQCKLF